MGYSIAKVPCSACGKDLANKHQGLIIGLCNHCEKLYCSKCFQGLKDRCPLCKKKLTVKARVSKWPKKWQPLMIANSAHKPISRKHQDFSEQLRGQMSSNKFCRSCNRKLKPDSRYCDLCGTKLKAKLI